MTVVRNQTAAPRADRPDTALRSVRMLQLIAPAPFGGAESVTRALSREYPGQALLVALTQFGGAHPFVEQSQEEGLEVVQLSAGRRRYDKEIAAVREQIAQFRPDVVHTHVYHSDFVGYRAAKTFGLPVVAHVHGITGGDRKDRFYQWLDLKLLRRFDALVCVSESVRQKILDARCAPERVHLVPNPYSAQPGMGRAEARAALGLNDQRPVVGWIGRVSIEKGADLFAQALAKLPKPRPLAVIIGAGPEDERLRRVIQELQLENDVRLIGERPNAGRLLRAFDALVLSSRTEGLPMVLLEAMGAKVPIVSFAVGGVPDAIDEQTAWMATEGDTGALADAIARSLANPVEATRRSVKAEEIVQQRYSAEVWANRIARIHADLKR
jgi:glycosyltransferase involved in cell wall biosynthesis